MWRQCLFAKLENIGFGGKTLSLLQSMYKNDSIKFLINGHYSDELWLTQGVKQGTYLATNNAISKLYKRTLGNFSGCNLSPLLFCLFISQLGMELNNTGLGIDLGTVNIAAVFFADDICLISRNKSTLNQLMDITRTFFKSHKLVLSETKSKVLNYNAETGQTTFDGDHHSPLTLESVLHFKYLGVRMSCSPYNMFKAFNDQVREKSRTYMTSVLSLVKTGPDQASLAHTLWTLCGLPSILHGCEVIPITQGTIDEVERCQKLVGKFMLQIPRSSADVSCNLDAGLKPIWAVLAEKVLLYVNKLLSKPNSYWPRIALTDHITLGSKSPYVRYLLKWKTATNSFGLDPKQIRNNINSTAISCIRAEQRKTCVTTFAMNCPVPSSRWFKPKPWVNDSCSSKIIAQYRACNTGLGNRGPAKDGNTYKLCPLCARNGITILNNEVFTLSIVP